MLRPWTRLTVLAASLTMSVSGFLGVSKTWSVGSSTISTPRSWPDCLGELTGLSMMSFSRSCMKSAKDLLERVNDDAEWPVTDECKICAKTNKMEKLYNWQLRNKSEYNKGWKSRSYSKTLYITYLLKLLSRVHFIIQYLLAIIILNNLYPICLCLCGAKWLLLFLFSWNLCLLLSKLDYFRYQHLSDWKWAWLTLKTLYRQLRSSSVDSMSRLIGIFIHQSTMQNIMSTINCRQKKCLQHY